MGYQPSINERIIGQQQILLLVFTLVLVSIAVYAGISVFNRSLRQRHADMLMNHAVHAASEAAVWYSKASPFLGGSDSYADLSDEGMAKFFMNQGRPPGTVKITSATKNTLEITAVSNTYEDIGVLVKVEGVDIVVSTIAYDGSIALP